MTSSAPTAWKRTSPWAGLLVPGRFGAAGPLPGVTIMPREALLLATIIARHDREQEIDRALLELAGVTPPKKPAIARGHCDLVWAGPNEWLLVSTHPDILENLPAALDDLAAVSDQSDSRAILRLSGTRIRDMLMKGPMIDLHPRVFHKEDAALTTIGHIGVHLWQIDEAPTYDIAVARSMAGSFWRWLSAAASEFGFDVLSADRKR